MAYDKKASDRAYRQKHKEEMNIYKREYYEKNKERYVEYHRKTYAKTKVKKAKRVREYCQEIKLKVLSHYSNGKLECACCEEKHYGFLTIDHINGGGRKHIQEVAKGKYIMFYNWLIKNNYPKGFQVLCYNCNCAKGHHGICPHEVERQEANKEWDIKQVQTLENMLR